MLILVKITKERNFITLFDRRIKKQKEPENVINAHRTLLEKPPLQKFTAAVNLIKDARNIKVTFVLTLIEVKIQS